jgi:hypothetical protein
MRPCIKTLLTLAIAASTLNCQVQEKPDMVQTESQCVSIEQASKGIHVPEDLIKRAVKNGLAIPVKTEEPYFFTKEEIDGWKDYNGVGRFIQSRLKRTEQKEYLGQFIEPGEYMTRNAFILPFQGPWLVTDGGKEKTHDGHMRSCHYYIAPCIRWAWDLSVVSPLDYGKCRIGMSVEELLRLRFREGQKENTPDYEMSEPWEDNEYRKILNGDASKTETHYCYEIDIIAPADGVVMTRDGSLSDPSFTSEVNAAKQAHDNRQMSFMIDHDQSEFSQIAHILARTVAVKPGEKVKRGQFLCKAGGQQFMPHLHWGVWDSWHPLFAQSLPISISACLVYENGDFVRKTNVWLERGMLVKNPD